MNGLIRQIKSRNNGLYVERANMAKNIKKQANQDQQLITKEKRERGGGGEERLNKKFGHKKGQENGERRRSSRVSTAERGVFRHPSISNKFFRIPVFVLSDARLIFPHIKSPAVCPRGPHFPFLAISSAAGVHTSPIIFLFPVAATFSTFSCLFYHSHSSYAAFSKIFMHVWQNPMKNVEQNQKNDGKNVPEIVINIPSESLPKCSMDSTSNNAKDSDDQIELSYEKPSTSKQFIPSTTKMVATRMEEWTEENSGWAKPTSVKWEPIKEEWGKTTKTQQNGWKNVTVGWNDYSAQNEIQKEKKWDELEAEENLMHNNSFDGQFINQFTVPKWGAKVKGTTRDDGGKEEEGSNDGTTGGGYSTGNGTILVVSGLTGANIAQDELRTLVNFMAGNGDGYGCHIIGAPFFPHNSADMAFFQMNSESTARKAQNGLEGFKVEGCHTKKLHAAIVPNWKNPAGINSTMGNTQIEQPIQWDIGRFINSPVNEMGNGGRDSNNFGEDQSDEMADNEQQHTHVKWNNATGEEEEDS